jgi:anaphase-promoting complex subunit 2
MAAADAVRASWKLATGPGSDDAVAAAVRQLHAAGLSSALRARVLRDADTAVARPAAAAITAALGRDGHLPDAARAAFDAVCAAALRASWLDKVVGVGACGGGPLLPCLLLRVRAHLAAYVPQSLSRVLQDVFRKHFREYGDEEGVRVMDEMELARFRSLCMHLVALGFMPAVQDAVGWVLFEKIDEAVRVAASSRLGDRVLPRLRCWVDRAVIPWLQSVLSVAAGDPDDALLAGGLPAYPSSPSADVALSFEHGAVTLAQWRKRLAFRLHETLATVRIDQMIQLVAFYPQSLMALQDLKECLICTDKKCELISSLRSQFSSQLLHAGSMTSDIIQQYLNMIKGLRFLDPTGVILEGVSDPVRTCLRRRADTVRCIVSGMTGDGDLFQELERGRLDSSRAKPGSSLVQSTAALTMPSDADDGASDAGDNSEAGSLSEEEFANWEAEPLDAPVRQGRWRPGGDAIATLVAIYGSSDQIVSEYRAVLADRLMSSFDVDLDREERILELLQQRFGLEAMHDCVIMIKDMKDSRIALATARAETPAVARELERFETTVISKEFWPKLAEEPSFEPPETLSSRMGCFGASFERVKNPRKLRWMHGYGMIKLNVTFDDGRRLNLALPPLQAAIVLRFSERPKWTVKELQDDLAIDDEAALRRRLVLLANHDVIRATDSTASAYETIERAEDLNSTGGVVDEDPINGSIGDGEGNGEDGLDDEADMSVYLVYILAMLRNLKSLPLERIHDMLQTFCKTPAYDKTQTQLAAFLAQLVADEKIALHAGMYKVKG